MKKIFFSIFVIANIGAYAQIADSTKREVKLEGAINCRDIGGYATKEGKHASTDKSISPLAPAFNSKRFTDETKVNKWFKRNCNDVLGRECSSLEKADVMAYLNSLK